LRLSYFSKSRKGLSLVEMLVVVFIFGIIITIISTALVQGFMTGRLNSQATKDINRELNAATGLISQKMIGANYQAYSTPNTVYGFKIIGSNILAIASSGTPNQCSFFGVKSDQRLYMKQTDCTGSPITDPANLDQPITTGITKITDFSFPSYYNFVSGVQTAPYVC
jgi:prepilin-type N-terminal cleavage/methylation domain-containing protein